MALERYWVPLDSVIEFKREVYRLALNELATYVERDRRAPAHTVESA